MLSELEILCGLKLESLFSETGFYVSLAGLELRTQRRIPSPQQGLPFCGKMLGRELPGAGMLDKQTPPELSNLLKSLEEYIFTLIYFLDVCMCVHMHVTHSFGELDHLKVIIFLF